MGRVYLPAEDLRRFGCSESSVLSGEIDAKFVALMQFQIARVRTMYDEAAPGIALLDPGTRFTVRLALSLYRAILDRIERNRYDVFTLRAYVPLRAKIAMAFGVLLRSISARNS
jgi:phytoene synthase